MAGEYSNALGGSAGVAHYLASAALALAEASHFPSVAASAAFAAHETLSDILMTSPPLSAAELQEAVRTALRDAQEDDMTLADFSRLPSFHS